MLINGSPRAPKSNSKGYAQLFEQNSKEVCEYVEIKKNNHQDLIDKMADFTDIVFVFPLYADRLPVTLLNFLKSLENNPPKQKGTVSILINCGFIEPEQNQVAIKMLQYFCKQNGYKQGAGLSIGGGEAILGTPFKFLVKGKIKKLAKAVAKGEPAVLQTTMPLSKKAYLKASTNYWINYGKKYGVTKEEMETMTIEK